MKYTNLFFFLFLFSPLVFSQVSKDELEQLKIAITKSYEEINVNENELFFFNPTPGTTAPDFWWIVDNVHFSYVQHEIDNLIQHNIYIMGGLARLKGMIPDALAIAACHELGHAKGGRPFLFQEGIPLPVSIEGQSDYFAARTCLPKVLKHLKPLRKIKKSKYNQKLCKNRKNHSLKECLRMLNSIDGMIALFKSHYKTETFINRRSEHLALDLIMEQGHYPEPQCRIDTYIHGILGLERPKCWYPENNGNHSRH